jgi:hypothetical protein
MRYMATYGDHPTPAETQAAIKLELIDRKRRVTVAYQEWKDEVQERKRLHDNAQQLMQEESKARRARTTAAGQKPFAPEYSPQPFRDAPIPAWIEEEAKRMGVTLNFRAGARSVFARSSASTKALRTIYNYLEVVRTEWGEDRGIEAGRELQKAAKAIAADPSSQDIAAEIAQLVRVATTDKSYDKRDRALDDLESIINQAQSQHSRHARGARGPDGQAWKPSTMRDALYELAEDYQFYVANMRNHPEMKPLTKADWVSKHKDHITKNADGTYSVERVLPFTRNQSAKRVFSASFGVGDWVDIVDGQTSAGYGQIASINNNIAVIETASGKIKAKTSNLELVKKGSPETLRQAGFGRKGKTSMAQADFKVGDKVHLGFASKGAVGFDGVITKIDSETVYIQSPEIGQFGPRTFKGPVRFLSHGFAGYYAEHSRSGSKAAFARSLVASQGNKRIYLDGPDGNDNFNIYLVQLVNTGIPNESPHEDLLRMKSYSTEARARVAAKKMLSSRNGVKSLMQKEYVLWGVPEGETDQLHAKVLSTQAKTPSEMDEIKRRASAAGWHSFRVQILDPDKPTRMFSRNGAKSMMQKAKFGQPNTVAVRKTLRGNYEVIYWDANGKEQTHTLNANEEHAKEGAKDLARQLGMQFVAGRSRFGIAERVLNDGSVHLDFKVFRESLSGKSDSSLNFIMRDAADARDAMGPDGKKFNYYADIVNEVGDEIARRKNGKSRSNRSGDRKQSFEAGDSFMVEGYVGEMITGGRSARTMEEAEHYANAMLAMIKRNAGGKPVKVEIQEIKAYSPQGVVKTMHSRSDDPVTNMVMKLKSKIARQTPREGTENFHKQVLRELDSILSDIKNNSRDPEVQQLDMTDVKSRLQAMAPRGSAVMRELDSWAGFARKQSEISTRFGSIASKLGFLPDSITESNGVATLKFAQADGSAGRCAFAMIRPLTGIVGSDRVTATDTEVRVQFTRGGKAEFGSDVILEDIGDDQVRATARVEGRSAGSFDGPKSQSAQLLLKALKIAGQGHEVSSGVYDMTYIKLNDAAKRAMPKSAMMSRGGKAEFAQANQQIADGVAQLLSVLGFAAMAEEAKTTTDADTLKRFVNVARRRIKGSDQADRFNTLADKLERMLMSRGGGKAGFGEIGSGGSYVSNALHHISNDITRGDKDMAKAMMRKLAERIGKESHTDAEWNQYLSLARSLGFSDNAVAGFSRSDEKSESFKKLLSQNVSQSNLREMEKAVDKAITYAKKVGDDELLDLAEETGIECSALRSRASRLGTKTRFEMDQTTHRHLMTWIDNQLGNRAGSAGYIADKMIGTFNDDPERWADQGWSKVFDAAGLSSADFNNPKKGWD